MGIDEILIIFWKTFKLFKSFSVPLKINWSSNSAIFLVWFFIFIICFLTFGSLPSKIILWTLILVIGEILAASHIMFFLFSLFCLLDVSWCIELWMNVWLRFVTTCWCSCLECLWWSRARECELWPDGFDLLCTLASSSLHMCLEMSSSNCW